MGSGWFHASRQNAAGEKYIHKGLDTLVTPGAPVYAPADATVERFGTCYEDVPCMDLIALDVGGGFLIKILYVEPQAVIKGQHVRRGDAIGVAQDVTERRDYKAGGMLPHLHTEVWYDGKTVDPARMMGIKREI